MALNYGFFNSINGDRKYDARWFAKYFASFIGNGVFPNPSTGLQVVESENMTVIVKPGDAWINGYYANNDTDFHITLDNSDGLLKRIDRVVLRWNQIDRVMEIATKKGAFSENPVAPVLQRDGDYYELGLADVFINKGTTIITQANIADLRLSNEYCGIVHGVVNQVDTTTLFNQYQSWIEQQKTLYESELATWTSNQKLSFEQWMTQQQSDWQDWQDAQNQDFLDWRNVQQADFGAWYANVQNILDGDVAGNLLNLINANTARIEGVEDAAQEIIDSKGQPNGISTLDGNSQVPVNQLGNVAELILPSADVLAYEQIADITLTEDVTGGVTISGLEKYKIVKLFLSIPNKTTGDADGSIRINGDSTANSHTYTNNLTGSTTGTSSNALSFKSLLSSSLYSLTRSFAEINFYSVVGNGVYVDGFSGTTSLYKTLGTYRAASVSTIMQSITIITAYKDSRIIAMGVLKDA